VQGTWSFHGSDFWRQEPNRLTRYFQQMKQTCPETIRAYAQCVIQAEQAERHVKRGL
jgi:hypothetical protein